MPPEDPKLIHSQDPARITDKTLIATAYYYRPAAHSVARYARILDKPTDAADLEARPRRVNDAFQQRFFKPASRIYDNGTQTSSILPLYFQMVPAEARAGRAGQPGAQHRENKQRPRRHRPGGRAVADAHAFAITAAPTSPTRSPRRRPIPVWGYMVDQGATTIWELWNGDTADPAMNSGNHVMQIGDLAVWMYEYLAGIRSDPENPGFRHASSALIRRAI